MKMESRSCQQAAGFTQMAQRQLFRQVRLSCAGSCSRSSSRSCWHLWGGSSPSRRAAHRWVLGPIRRDPGHRFRGAVFSQARTYRPELHNFVLITPPTYGQAMRFYGTGPQPAWFARLATAVAAAAREAGGWPNHLSGRAPAFNQAIINVYEPGASSRKPAPLCLTRLSAGPFLTMVMLVRFPDKDDPIQARASGRMSTWPPLPTASPACRWAAQLSWSLQ